ncbi:sulfotransferase [Rhodocaloribacter sp.]
MSLSEILSVVPRLWSNTSSLFVLSTGRTGTETLTHILALSNQIDAFHEPYPQLLDERKYARTEVYVDPGKYYRIFSRSRSLYLWKSQRRGKLYAETSARLTFFAPVIYDMLPNSKFLYIHRHPAEVVRSGMRRGWYVDHPADYARIVPVKGEYAFERWEKWSPFEKICWYWDAYNRFSLGFVDSVSPDRVIQVRADELFSGRAIDWIFDLINLRKPDSDLIDEELSKKHNIQQGASFPVFEEWTEEMKQTLYRHAGETMRRLGYDVVSLHEA